MRHRENDLQKTLAFLDTQYVGDTVKTLYTAPEDLRKRWSDFEQRSSVIELLEQRGIDFDELAAAAGHLKSCRKLSRRHGAMQCLRRTRM